MGFVKIYLGPVRALACFHFLNFLKPKAYLHFLQDFKTNSESSLFFILKKLEFKSRRPTYDISNNNSDVQYFSIIVIFPCLSLTIEKLMLTYVQMLFYLFLFEPYV